MKLDLENCKTIIEEIIELVLIFDKQGGILFGNRAAREKLEYTSKDLKDCSMTNIFRQEFEKKNGEIIPFELNVLMQKTETVMYKKKSSCFPVSVRILPIRDGYYCLIAEDISFRKDMDVRIRRLNEDEKTNRQQRDEFTANVTHELRTPVNGIRGHVMSLLETIQDPEQRKTLEIILYCCDNMSSIINNILDFSKLGAGKFKLEEREFDFYKMMDSVIATHMATINQKELRINVYIDENIPRHVIGDELRISQILNNLLSNAVKFTMVGQINVDVSMTMQINNDIELFFIVRDSGIGISKEDQDKLFQSYKQVDASITRRFGGTGLGLSITKQLVEMMKGTIHVESEKGRGSSFSFNIRLRTAQNPDEAKPADDAYKKWSSISVDMEREAEDRTAQFGSKENKEELRKRMDKLILSIELGSWDKAETMAGVIKFLTEGAEGDVKKLILRMEMAIRKESYDKSVEAYKRLQDALAEQLKGI